MLKLTTCAALLVLLLTACLRQPKAEKEEVAFWKSHGIDSAYSLLYREKDTVNALRLYDSAIRSAGVSSVYTQALRFDLLSNYYYFFTPDNRATTRMIDAALSLYNTPELQNHYPHTYVGLLLFGGQIAYRLSQYSKANDYYFRAKVLADAYLNPCERTAFNYNIAMVLFRQQNFRESAAYFENAYRLQESCAPQTTAVVLQQQEIQGNIGECLVELKKYDSALFHFDKALQIAHRYKDSLGSASLDKIEGVIAGDKARVSVAKNRLAEAEQLSLKSIALNDRPGYEQDDALRVKLRLAEIYSLQKEYASMIKILRGQDLALNLYKPQIRQELNRLLAAYFEQTGQSDSALRYLKRYFILRDSLSEEQKLLTTADVARQLHDKTQQGQIAVLTQDKRNAQVFLWATVLFSVMALTILYLIYRHYRRSKKSLAVSLALNDEIRREKAAREEEARQRHRLITQAVIRAQENERSLIGLELHDNVNQVLTTVKLHNEMLLEGVGDPAVILPKTITYLNTCIHEIRSLSKRLSAPTLGKISLEESVRDLIESINLTAKVKITPHIEGLKNQTLKQEIHTGVYRILQEQLNNVLKHAEASKVTVRLVQKEDQICLSVTDNGKGFVVQSRKDGIGLVNMQTRAENLNGTFSLKSEPGKGCVLSVQLPLPTQEGRPVSKGNKNPLVS